MMSKCPMHRNTSLIVLHNNLKYARNMTKYTSHQNKREILSFIRVVWSIKQKYTGY